jgi:PAS domain-containing protein
MGANDGLWDWDLTTNAIHYSTRWKAIIGCDDATIGSDPEEWFNRVHPEDLVRLRREIDHHLSGHSPHLEIEHRMRHAGGSFRWVLTRGMAVRDHRHTRPDGGLQSDIEGRSPTAPPV